MTTNDQSYQADLLPTEMQPPPRDLSRCSRCKEPVFFSKTVKGARGIFDWKPVEGGNIVIDRNGVAHYLAPGKPNETAGPRYQSHFVSCPFASEFRS